MPSVRKNFAFSLVYEFLALAIPLVTAPYLSRVLGPNGLGSYSLSYNIAYYFGMFAILGMSKYGAREIAAVRSDGAITSRCFWELFLLQLVSSVVCIAAYIAYAGFVGDGLTWIWLPYLLSQALDITWLFRGEEDFGITVVRNSAVKVATAVAIFIFVKTSNDVPVYAGIMSLGYLISQVALWPYLRRYVRQVVWPNPRVLMSRFRPDLLLFVPLVATSIYRVMDKILIGLLSNDAQLGFFDCADKIIMVPLGVVSALGAVMLPRIAHMLATGESQAVGRYIRVTMNLSLCMALGLMFGILGVGQLFAVVYFGADFAESGSLLMVLGSTVPVIAWASVVREQYLVPRGLDTKYLASTVAGAVVNLALNFIAIPLWGAQGAAAVTVVTELVVCVSLSRAVRHELDFTQFLWDAVPYVLIGVLMLGGIWGVGVLAHPLGSLASLLLQVLSGIFIYAAGMVCLCCLSKSHRKLFGQMLNR